jgi:E3 ubiquitin-protein ligase BRE1
VRVLKIQNKKLAERLEHRQRVECELREKIEKLQNRKASDDSKLCIVDRYWTQLDEDMRLLLDRFDITNKSDVNSCSTDSVKNFLNKLSEWDKIEIDDKLKDRVKFTTQYVAKLIGIFDKYDLLSSPNTKGKSRDRILIALGQSKSRTSI